MWPLARWWSLLGTMTTWENKAMKSITERWTTALAWPLGGCPMPTGSKVSLVVNQLAGVVCCLGDGMADQCVNKVDWPEQFGIVGVYYIETTVCTLYLDLYIYIRMWCTYIYIYTDTLPAYPPFWDFVPLLVRFGAPVSCLHDEPRPCLHKCDISSGTEEWTSVRLQHFFSKWARQVGLRYWPAFYAHTYFDCKSCTWGTCMWTSGIWFLVDRKSQATFCRPRYNLFGPLDLQFPLWGSHCKPLPFGGLSAFFVWPSDPKSIIQKADLFPFFQGIVVPGDRCLGGPPYWAHPSREGCDWRRSMLLVERPPSLEAMMLATARLLKDISLGRSVLFMAPTAEEYLWKDIAGCFPQLLGPKALDFWCCWPTISLILNPKCLNMFEHYFDRSTTVSSSLIKWGVACWAPSFMLNIRWWAGSWSSQLRPSRLMWETCGARRRIWPFWALAKAPWTHCWWKRLRAKSYGSSLTSNQRWGSSIVVTTGALYVMECRGAGSSLGMILLAGQPLIMRRWLVDISRRNIISPRTPTRSTGVWRGYCPKWNILWQWWSC